ncbi:hypothetical protein [Gluconobacter albidus]|uniref:hypothetical protein n=1 Tax=Gluconobacter albidus TaxID=318683 RepID=UPI0011EA5469|nr:hypothetical protein [Gluconobacter albidus]
MSNLSMNMVLSCCLQRNKACGLEECFPVSNHDVLSRRASCASADLVQDGDIIPSISQKIHDCTSEERRPSTFSGNPVFFWKEYSTRKAPLKSPRWSKLKHRDRVPGATFHCISVQYGMKQVMTA